MAIESKPGALRRLGRLIGGYGLAFSAGCFLYGGPGQQCALAAGLISLDSLSFFKSSRDRESFSSMLLLEPRFAGEGLLLRGVADLKAATFISENPSFAADARELYVSTSARWSPLHEIAAGRRLVDWSVADKHWNIGAWSPRFTLDPFQWESIGMTGFFYGYRSKSWTLTAMASPVSVPEQGIPLSESDGKLIYASPMAVPLQEKVEVMGQLVDIRYGLKFPPISDIVLRPAGALAAKYRDESGFWGGASYGYLPIHQPDIAVDATLNANAGEVRTDLHPRFPMHHLATAEVGYDAPYWSIWGSVTGELPEKLDTPQGWLTNRVGDALITSWGGELRWQEGLSMRASYLQVDENRPDPEEGAIDIVLPERYLYRRAWKVGAGWSGGSPISYDFGWIFDADHSSNLVSLDVRYSPGTGRIDPSRQRWAVGFGADFISTATGTGWIGQYQGNDRVRGKVSYAF
ncbi:MAG: hypothetical protein IT285_01620 [Bdellovibrionales bacterium]|nr:hypothetical protein [Bdellovibrionales bacterium]